MNKIIIALIIIAIVVFGGYFIFRGSYQAPTLPSSSQRQIPQPEATQESTSQQTLPEETLPTEENVVTYTDSGYLPSTITVKVGTTVTFKNESSQAMWTASAMHPTHSVYGGTSLAEHCPDTSGTAFDACTGIQPGNSWTFTFTKVGTWKYHNHLAPAHTGTIVVE